MIRQNLHHPSVAFWGVGNEVTQADPDGAADQLVSSLASLAMAEDPSRVNAIAHCCTADDGSVVQHTDAVGYNRYFGWYGGSMDDLGPWADALHLAHPDLSIGITEYGAGASTQDHTEVPVMPESGGPDHPEEYQALLHERAWDQISERPWLFGSFVWNMFDFASDSRAEGDAPGINDKGLVTYDRQVRKDAFWFYKASWSDEPVLHLTGARYQDRVSRVVEIKAYSNANFVNLIVNGQPHGHAAAAPVYRWTNFMLEEGENVVTAEAVINNQVIRDEVVWNFAPPHRVWLPALRAPGESPTAVNLAAFRLPLLRQAACQFALEGRRSGCTGCCGRGRPGR